IEGRARTRLIMVQAAVWAASWGVLGLAGLVPATALASTLVASAFGLFAVGETLQAPVANAIVNDVAPERLRGRYGAVSAFAFNVAGIVAPPVSGFVLGTGRAALFIAMLVAGCALLAVAAVALERVLPRPANGLADEAAPRAA